MQAPLADLINAVSVANKVGHAHLHAYELHLSAADIDPHATVSGSAIPGQRFNSQFCRPRGMLYEPVSVVYMSVHVNQSLSSLLHDSPDTFCRLWLGQPPAAAAAEVGFGHPEQPPSSP